MARLVDLLTSDATKRVEGETFIEPKAPPLTVQLRGMAGRYKRAMTAANRITKALRRRGLAIDEKGTITPRYDATARRRNEWRVRQNTRLGRVRQLRNKALLDLIDMTPKDQKRYLIRLKRELESI